MFTKKLLTAAVITSGLLLANVASAHTDLPNFYDNFTVNLHSFSATAPAKILSLVATGGVSATQQGDCTSGQCFFNIHGKGDGSQGNVQVTIGTDVNHACTVFLQDGAWMMNAIETRPPACTGGVSADATLAHNQGTYNYSFSVNNAK